MKHHTIHILLTLATLGAALATPAKAQPNPCRPGQTKAFLEANNVRAQIFNDGLLFGQVSTPDWIYEVPKGSGLTALWNASLVIGGIVEDEIRAAASIYGPPEFWPGPIDDQGRPPKDCFIHDRIYHITRQALEQYNETGLATPDLLQWPASFGAPVIDGDGIEGNYDLAGGDRPALVGDEMLWWIMNDAGGEHTRTQSQPLGLEIQATAFAYRANNYLDNTTFYRYRLRYKGRTPLQHAHFGILSDTRATDGENRNIATDTTLGIAYIYYTDNYDASGWDDRPAYGEAPPALGFAFLRTAAAETDRRDNDHDGLVDEPGEQQGLTATIHNWNGGGIVNDPRTAQDFYNYLRARWRDGKPLTVGGNGRSFSTTPTRFAYPGDPITGAYWSAVNCNNRGDPCFTSVRYTLSTGPFSMQPGDELEFTFALVWSRGDDYLDSVRQLRDDVRHLHAYADVLLEPVSLKHQAAPKPQPTLGFGENYPNPFSGTTTIRYSLPQPMHVRLTVYDALGRMVETLVDARQAEGVYAVDFDGAGRSPGLYVYRIEMDHLSTTRRMLLLR